MHVDAYSKLKSDEVVLNIRSEVHDQVFTAIFSCDLAVFKLVNLLIFVEELLLVVPQMQLSRNDYLLIPL